MEKLAVSPHLEELKYCINSFFPSDTRKQYLLDIVFRIENAIDRKLRDEYETATDNFVRNIGKFKN